MEQKFWLVKKMSWTAVAVRRSLKDEISEELVDSSYGNFSQFVDIALRNELEKLQKKKVNQLYIRENSKNQIKS